MSITRKTISRFVIDGAPETVLLAIDLYVNPVPSAEAEASFYAALGPEPMAP